MAHFLVNFYSRCLEADTELVVSLPEENRHPLRTLWVLHGAFGDAMGAHNLISLQREAGRRGIAVVCPSVYHGFYMDMAHGERWYTFLSTELLPWVRSRFLQLSTKREDNYVLGLSMGGYGAYKWAVNEPETFSAAGSFSSPLNMKLVMERLESGKHPGGHDLYDAFGSAARIAGTRDDMLWVLQRLLQSDRPCPKLFQLCGMEDFAWEENELARDAMRALGAPLTFVSAHGEHTNEFWDQHLETFLDWLPKEVE